jgi:hypothetical protein
MSDYFRHARLVLIFLIILTGFREDPGVVSAYQEDICTAPFQTVSLPLSELGTQPYTRMDGQVTSYSGGLYPNGSNTRPADHEAAGRAAAEQIQPRNALGETDYARGKIVMISVGMSNTSYEFETFSRLVNADSQVNPRLVLVNGALSSQTAEFWVDSTALPWQNLDQLLTRYDISPLQVQAAWVKLTLTRGGEFPAKALQLQSDLETIARNLKARFPNLQIAYFSSRTRSYTYFRGLSPEPLAFETGFAVKWMIEKQIQGDPALNYDPTRGDVKAPFLSWGPYLWADGQNPRGDGLVWLPEDMTSDCTHPTTRGQQKVAQLLVDFFKSDSTTGWFLAQEPVQHTPPSPAAPATGTSTAEPTLHPTPQPTQTRRVQNSATPAITLSPSNAATPIPTLAGPPEGEPLAPILYLALIFSSITLVGGWLWVQRRK